MFRLNATDKDGQPIAFVVPIPATTKRPRLRYPTDKEWCDRVHALKIVRTSLGRDKSQSDVPGQAAADLALYERIRKDDTVVDPAEASFVIDLIDRNRIASVEQEGERYRITLEGLGFSVSHLVRIPLQSESSEYEARSLKPVFGKRSTELLPALEPAGVLYDRVIVESSGYAGSVPITHKHAVIRELLDQVDALVSDNGIELPE